MFVHLDVNAEDQDDAPGPSLVPDEVAPMDGSYTDSDEMLNRFYHIDRGRCILQNLTEPPGYAEGLSWIL